MEKYHPKALPRLSSIFVFLDPRFETFPPLGFGKVAQKGGKVSFNTSDLEHPHTNPVKNILKITKIKKIYEKPWS